MQLQPNMSKHRLVAPLAIPFAFAACMGRDNDDPISPAEQVAMSAAVEATVVAFSPITSANVQAIADAYTEAYPQEGGVTGASCASIETDLETFVNITFACPGLLQTTGTLSLTVTSGTTVETTADLKIGSVVIQGAHTLHVPADPGAERTFDGALSIEGPRRELETDSHASWVVTGNCVTFSASGSIFASGPRGSGEADIAITDRTVCRL